MFSRRHVLEIAASVLVGALAANAPSLLAQKPKTVTVTLTVDGMT